MWQKMLQVGSGGSVIDADCLIPYIVKKWYRSQENGSGTWTYTADTDGVYIFLFRVGGTTHTLQYSCNGTAIYIGEEIAFETNNRLRTCAYKMQSGNTFTLNYNTGSGSSISGTDLIVIRVKGSTVSFLGAIGRKEKVECSLNYTGSNIIMIGVIRDSSYVYETYATSNHNSYFLSPSSEPSKRCLYVKANNDESSKVGMSLTSSSSWSASAVVAYEIAK